MTLMFLKGVNEMKDEKRRLLSKVAYLYFIEEKSQTEISVELDIYRTTVSRMITRAKKEGIIKIYIEETESEIFKLEEYIQSKYHLKRVEIVDNNTEETETELANNISQRAAALVKHLIKEKDIVGISWGSTLSKMVEKIEVKTVKDVSFCPLAGGPSHINTKYHVNTLVYEMARLFQGQSTFINSTVVQNTEEIAYGVLRSKYFQELLMLWNELDLAIVGVGGNLIHNKSQWRDLLDKTDYAILAKEKAVGEVCCRFFNENGEPIHGKLQKRIIGLTLDQLSRVPKSVAVAYGDNKAWAILAILKRGYVNHLVLPVAFLNNSSQI